MSLYLKHRPTDWDEIIGNEETVQALQRMLEKGNPPHSYLFVGGTGCGKTTIARILADKLGCQGHDYREVNFADTRGIDTVREIIQNAKYKPMEGKCRVYVLDEAHKQTSDAQNALLKILEDTPEHVYFMLCTTDPQKLISTVKGRCQTFNMQNLSDKEMLKLLVKTAKAEKESIEKEIYLQIVDDAQGHPRNALQVLEKVLSVEPENRLEIARKTAEQQNEVIELCRALLGGHSWKRVAPIIAGLKGQDPEGIRRVILGYCQSVLLKEFNPQAAVIMEQFREPLWDIGFPGVVLNCCLIINGE